MEPENNKTRSPNGHKLNMAENMTVNFIKKMSKNGKKQKGYTTERFMPGNAVIMLIFRIKRINLSPKKINVVVSFSCVL